ncbi:MULTISPECIES: monofunctional biosynthetic peptidoglycan transglycosylase [unclassified Thioalkalivibrio]|uniref:monofunctional biosynthetic peptidoglycan transglycosylase n=1 Tax=unclassified Thioalkalivibrio TaxID=2621013 RepID=UPI0003631114|nr:MULTISPECIES: monofunctional biosynthetic peptidoglycan transglycosylase [unclassified Thioalkalivibrio]
MMLLGRRRRARPPGPLRYLLWLLVALLGLVLAAVVAVLLYFARVDPPYGMAMVTATDRATASRYRPQWRSLEELPDAVLLAVIASEDQRFPRHRGFDWSSVRQALTDHARGGRLRGASTITQQTAKNLFLWHERSWLRKALEAGLTVGMELLWSKERILEVYLNLAQWGPGIYGIENAAQHYFDVPASELTPQQAARLAAILPSPGRLDPVTPGETLERRIAWIEEQMGVLGPGWLRPVRESPGTH